MDESDVLEESWPFLVIAGELLQALNDFLDVFGDIEATGKVGTDIAEGRLTWVAGEVYMQ